MAKMVMIRNSRWPLCPYMVKKFKRLLQNHRPDFADILRKCVASPYIKQLNISGQIENRSLVGRVNLGK